MNAPLIQWKKEYETGFPSIDFEHKTLIEGINDLYLRMTKGCWADEVSDRLGDIHALVESHFALEEKIMRDSRYPDYPLHKEDHDRLLEDIRDIMDAVPTDGDGEDEGPFRANLAEKIETWFATHFRTLDRDFHGKLGK